jgi:hypothetical protein
MHWCILTAFYSALEKVWLEYGAPNQLAQRQQVNLQLAVAKSKVHASKPRGSASVCPLRGEIDTQAL